MPSEKNLKGQWTRNGDRRIFDETPEPHSGIVQHKANLRNDLTYQEQAFVDEYIKDGDATKASIRAGIASADNRNAAHSMGTYQLTKPSVRAAIAQNQEEIHDENIADAKEIYSFLTAVMRGKILDQFSLDPSIKDRLTAAQMLAKLQIEMPNRVKNAQDNELMITIVRD